VFWSATERLGPQVVQFVVSIVLARLLLPKQFGLIGMLTLFLALGGVFLNSGFGAALIQKQDATEVHYSSVFYTNIVLSLVAAGILCLVAPWIAQFYNEPLLAPLTQVLSLNLVTNAFGVIQSVLLTKCLDFKTQTKVSLIASLGSGLVGIVMAALDFGVWSLVGQSVSLALLNTLLLWVFNTWRPRAVFSLAALRELFGFGSRLLASGLLNTVFTNIYSVVIGKLFTPADLGYYNRAFTLQQLPSQTVGGIVGRVTFPLFAEIQEDPARVRNGFRKALRSLALVNFPLMIGLAACARSLVLVLLTEKWATAIPYLQLLCIVGLLYPLHLINVNVILAHGRSDLNFWLGNAKRALIATNIAIAWRWGITAIIVGQILVSVIAYFLNTYYSRRVTGYPMRSQVLDVLPYLAAAGIMGGAVAALGWLPFADNISLIVSQVLLGSLIYVILCRGFRLTAFMDPWRIFQARIVAFARIFRRTAGKSL
jgi:O-antigen/teichoic acid export membrane protein